jgi:hypothetical protein
MGNSNSSYRHIAFSSFRHFFPSKFIKQIWLKMGHRRRKRYLGLDGFLWLGLFVAAHTYLPGLQQIFDLAYRLPQTMVPLSFVSVSAFCQYRNAFPLKMLLYIWRYLTQRLYQLYPSETIRWKGFRLLAIDGTILNLLEPLWPYFGALNGCRGTGPTQAYLVILYDLITRIPLAFRIGKAENNSRPRPLLKRLIKHLKTGDLLIIDLGFYSIEIFALLLNQSVNFIIPMRTKGRPKLLQRLSKNDGLYQIKTSRYWKNLSYVPEVMTVRIINICHPGFRPRRLVTSLLDSVTYSSEEIAELYHQRWHIETFFREFKHTLQVTHWHAHSLHAFYTEIIFQMLLVIITRLIMAEVSLKSGIPIGQLSFSRCLAEVRYALAIMVHLPIKCWIKVYEELLVRLSDYTIDIRLGRRFERDTQKRRKQSRSRYSCNIEKENKNVA